MIEEESKRLWCGCKFDVCIAHNIGTNTFRFLTNYLTLAARHKSKRHLKLNPVFKIFFVETRLRGAVKFQQGARARAVVQRLTDGRNIRIEACDALSTIESAGLAIAGVLLGLRMCFRCIQHRLVSFDDVNTSACSHLNLIIVCNMTSNFISRPVDVSEFREDSADARNNGSICGLCIANLK